MSGQLSSVKNRLNEQEKNDYSYYNTDRVVQIRYAQLFDTYRRRFFEVNDCFTICSDLSTLCVQGFGNPSMYIDAGGRSNELHAVPLEMRDKACAW